MNILIIEDEPLLADELEEILLNINSSHKVLAKLQSVEEAVKWINSNQCDLIFMDIQLSDGLSFSIFDKAQVQSPVIFTTAYDQYAIEAFNVNGISYILKPIDETEVVKALEKYELLKQSYLKNRQNLITDYSKNKSKYKEQLTLTLGPIKKIVDIKSIVFFQADDRYVFAFIKTGNRMFSNYTLRDLETILDPLLFFRINRTFIIYRGFVKEWMSYTKGRIKIVLDLDNSTDFIVSRSRTSEFKLWIEK